MLKFVACKCKLFFVHLVSCFAMCTSPQTWSLPLNLIKALSVQNLGKTAINLKNHVFVFFFQQNIHDRNRAKNLRGQLGHVTWALLPRGDPQIIEKE